MELHGQEKTVQINNKFKFFVLKKLETSKK